MRREGGVGEEKRTRESDDNNKKVLANEMRSEGRVLALECELSMSRVLECA